MTLHHVNGRRRPAPDVNVILSVRQEDEPRRLCRKDHFYHFLQKLITDLVSSITVTVESVSDRENYSLRLAAECVCVPRE